MSGNHTPGRIYFRAGGEANTYTLIDQATNNWRMTILLNGEQVTARQAADLERMASCWNACEGVPTEVLEVQQSGGLPWNVADQIEQRVQRDALLEALKGLVEAEESIRATYTRAYGKTPEDEDHYGHEKWAEEFLQERADEARAAIAKATGSAT